MLCRTLCTFSILPHSHHSIHFLPTKTIDSQSFVSLLLQKLSQAKSITKCGEIHARLIISGTIYDTYSANTLLNSYSKCGDLHHARLLFDKMPQRNVVSWTSIITAYARNGLSEIGVELFKQMVQVGEKPNQFTFSITICACIHHHFAELGLQIHGLIICSGLERDAFAGSSLVDMYSKMGCLDDSRKVFHSLFCRDSVSWNVMISGFAQVGDYTEVLRLFSEMQADGLSPNDFTFTSLLKCCCSLKEVEQIHGFVLKSAVQLDTVVGSALVDMYAKCHDVNSSQKVLDVMNNKDGFVWSAAISGYVRNDNGEKAVLSFIEMCNQGKKPDQHSLSGVLKACILIDEIETGTQIHSQMIKNGYQRDCFVASVLLDLYSDFGRLGDAEKIFRNISDRDLVAWNSMIMGYAQIEEFTPLCLSLFRELLQTTIKPDGITFVAVLKSCQNISDLETGRQIHTWILKFGPCSGTHVANAVINMYSRCGAVDDAHKAFDNIICRDEISWCSMIGSYVQNGLDLEALRFSKEMLMAGFCLNEFSYSSCLAACSGLEAMDLGRQFHALIVKAGLAKDVYVGSSAVDMYAKCGDIEDSIKSFCELQKPNIVSFNALISGFAQHGKADEAIQMFRDLENMDITPNKITFLAVLSACSHVGLVEESMIFFDSMRQKYGIKPESEHYCCLIDVFGRSGRVEEAYQIITGTEADLGVSVWRTLLSACRNHGNVAIGEISAMMIMELEPDDHASYVLLSNLYSEAGRWEEALSLRRKMVEVGVNKDPGTSWVIIREKVHAFLVRDFSHPEIEKILRSLTGLNQHMKIGSPWHASVKDCISGMCNK